MTAHTKIVGVRELRGNLSDYLRRTLAGENFDVVSRGKKVAQLRAPEDDNWPSADPKSPNFRKPGALKGKGYWIDDTFNDPMPDVEEAIEQDVFPPA